MTSKNKSANKTEKQASSIFNKQIAIPSDHGSWIFIITPLLIGFFAAQNWTPANIYLILAAGAAFLIRQPVLMMVKSYSGRRSRKDLAAARFWFLFYGLIGLTVSSAGSDRVWLASIFGAQTRRTPSNWR